MCAGRRDPVARGELDALALDVEDGGAGEHEGELVVGLVVVDRLDRTAQDLLDRRRRGLYDRSVRSPVAGAADASSSRPRSHPVHPPRP